MVDNCPDSRLLWVGIVGIVGGASTMLTNTRPGGNVGDDDGPARVRPEFGGNGGCLHGQADSAQHEREDVRVPRAGSGGVRGCETVLFGHGGMRSTVLDLKPVGTFYPALQVVSGQR